jgi:phage gpG-like protein
MTMTIDLGQALAALNRLAMLNMSPWLDSVGQKAQQDVQARIQQTKHDPESQPWSPWQPRTEKQRLKKGNAGQGLLWDEGTLLNTIKFSADSGGVTIGTEVGYAGYLQDGTQRMAARPFLGWSDAETTALEFSAIAFIEAML